MGKSEYIKKTNLFDMRTGIRMMLITIDYYSTMLTVVAVIVEGMIFVVQS